MAKNAHKVNKRVWKKWHPLQQAVFNRMFDSLRDQGLVNPKGEPLSRKDWGVVRWNSSWLAADCLWPDIDRELQ